MKIGLNSKWLEIDVTYLKCYTAFNSINLFISIITELKLRSLTWIHVGKINVKWGELHRDSTKHLYKYTYFCNVLSYRCISAIKTCNLYTKFKNIIALRGDKEKESWGGKHKGICNVYFTYKCMTDFNLNIEKFG